MKLTPIVVEEALTQHFALLFNRNESIVVRVASMDIPWLRAAIDKKNMCVLIEVNSKRSPFICSINGFKKAYGRIVVQTTSKVINSQNSDFISIECRSDSLYNVYARLVADIVYHLTALGISNSVLDFVVDRISGWSLLFSHNDNLAEEKGLIGELYVLNHLKENYNIPIQAWEGPMGSTKDIRLPEVDLEVKSTSIRYGYIVEISGIYQISIAGNAKLIFVRLEEATNGAFSVFRLLQELKGRCSNSEVQYLNEVTDQFTQELLKSTRLWNILEVKLFDMNSKFPLISRYSFKNDLLPPGVINIKWTADLGILDPRDIEELKEIINEN